jgi:hypothetical protein
MGDIMATLHTLSPEQKDEMVRYYEHLSDNDEDHYSALQCAAYNQKKTPEDHARLAVQVLLERYHAQGEEILKEKLGYHGGAYGENILHISIKYPGIFSDCCKALERVGMLDTMLLQKDGDNDTVMHQIVEYGRLDSFRVLVVSGKMELIEEAMKEENKFGETVVQLLEDFEGSKTVRDLCENNETYVTGGHFERAKETIDELKNAVDQNISRQGPGYRG